MEESTVVCWCTQCGARLTHEELEEHGLPSCPRCGYDGIPCDPADDCSLFLNWHELRILTIFAMHHANDLESIGPRQTVTAICKRLERQHPGKAPLTLAGEFKQLRDLPWVTNVEVRGTPDFDEFIEGNGPGAVLDAEDL